MPCEASAILIIVLCEIEKALHNQQRILTFTALLRRTQRSYRVCRTLLMILCSGFNNLALTSREIGAHATQRLLQLFGADRLQ